MFQRADTGSQHLLNPFVERSSRVSDTLALAWSEGKLTYGELYAMAREATERLEELCIPHGERVAIWGKKSPQAIAFILACLMTGRPVLIPPADLRENVLRELLEKAGTNHLVIPQSFEGAALPVSAQGVSLSGNAARGPEDWSLARSYSPDDVGLMLTTSGSTGVPKVVPLSYGALGRFAAWASAQFDIQPGTHVLSYCGLNFDLSILEVWTTLMRGGCVVLVAQEQATHGDHLLDLILTHEVEVLQGVPMFYSFLIDAALRHRRILCSVKHAILTGDSAPQRCLELLPRLFEDARLYNVYGCTETNDSFIHEFDVEHILQSREMTLGNPLPGVSALIVCDGQVVHGPGSGELWVSTPFQTSGYMGASSLSDHFVADPLDMSERIYFRTGDLVHRDKAGSTFLQGRSDLQVKVRGVRVNLQAVEQAILEDHEILEAVVVALDDSRAGKRLHVVVQRRDDTEINTLRLRERWARRLTPVAIPSIIEVVDQPLPKTSTGKIDREAVKCVVEGEGHE